MEGQGQTTLVRAALRPRMLVLLVVLVAAAVFCARLGAWQLDRAQVQRDRVAAAEAQVLDGESARPSPLDEVLLPQTRFDGDVLGRAVTVTGTWEPDGQLLVPGRALDGRTGAVVLTPLRVSGGARDGAVLPVARGWVASPADAAPAPPGEVTLTGYLQPAEAAGELDVAAGTAQSISTAQLVNVWGGPIYTGYLVLAASSAPTSSGIETLPAPQPGEGGGWDLRNLGYALQWWIFGLFAVGLWVRLVRDEAAGEPLPGAGDEVEAGARRDDAAPGSRAGVRGPAGDASA